MSAEQLRTLQQLSELFTTGSAKPQHIRQLSALLNQINQLAK